MGSSVAKFILLIFNGLLLLLGLIPFIFGIVALASKDAVDKMISFIPGTDNIGDIVDLNELIKNGAVYFVIIGLILAALGFLGFFGTCCKVKWMLIVYLILLVVILLVEIIVVIVAAAFPDTFNKHAANLFEESLTEYQGDCTVDVASKTVSCIPEHPVSRAWNAMQYELKCCGARGLNDYKSGNTRFQPRAAGALAPLTCCKHDDNNGFNNETVIPDITDTTNCFTDGKDAAGYYEEGCFEKLFQALVGNAVVICVMVAIAVVEIVLIIMTIILLRKLRSEK